MLSILCQQHIESRIKSVFEASRQAGSTDLSGPHSGSTAGRQSQFGIKKIAAPSASTASLHPHLKARMDLEAPCAPKLLAQHLTSAKPVEGGFQLGGLPVFDRVWVQVRDHRLPNATDHAPRHSRSVARSVARCLRPALALASSSRAQLDPESRTPSPHRSLPPLCRALCAGL